MHALRLQDHLNQGHVMGKVDVLRNGLLGHGEGYVPVYYVSENCLVLSRFQLVGMVSRLAKFNGWGIS